MTAWIRVRLLSSTAEGAVYTWADDEEREGWLIFNPTDSSFHSCDSTGNPPPGAMSVNMETQDLQNRDEHCWRSFLQAAYGVWKAYQENRSYPQIADRCFY